ncbi:MAG: sigma 54-interacting transcriptional regulator [Planctomycetota bacterium]
MLESELFGHERGAFTGAVKRREGRFELAHRGTLLLDEISEIAPALQAKLLRVIEEEEFERVGGSRTLRIDVRIIGTTNRDLKAEIRAGRFREDLYYRLQVVPLVIPPLRERASDVAKLADHFLAKHSRSNSSRVKGLAPPARDALLHYSWPGNVRELENVVQRSVVLDRHEWITPEDLAPPKEPQPSSAGVSVGKTVAEMEKELVLRALEHTNHNRSAAAKLLGFTTRTLTNKIRQYRAEGITVPGGRQRTVAPRHGARADRARLERHHDEEPAMNIDNESLHLIERMLDGAALRQQALANNLSNTSTPGYQRRDVRFMDELAQAIQRGGEIEPFKQVVGAQTGFGETPELETEIAELHKNGMVYDMALQWLQSKLRIYRMAISGRSV